MKERSTAHHHCEIVEKNGTQDVRLYSTDNLGNIWGEEFDSINRTNKVLERRRLALSLLSASISTTAYSLPFVFEAGLAKRNKLVRALGGIAALTLANGLLSWRSGIDEMVFETQGRIDAFQKAAKSQR